MVGEGDKAPGGWTLDVVAAMFSRFDEDGSGALSYKEFSGELYAVRVPTYLPTLPYHPFPASPHLLPSLPPLPPLTPPLLPPITHLLSLPDMTLLVFLASSANPPCP